MTFNNHYELEKYAKDNGYNSLEFTALGKSMKMFKFKFLDAYFGLVRMYNEGGELEDGFIRLSELEEAVIAYFVEE